MAALRDDTCPTLLLVGSEDPIVPVSVVREVQEQRTAGRRAWMTA